MKSRICYFILPRSSVILSKTAVIPVPGIFAAQHVGHAARRIEKATQQDTHDFVVYFRIEGANQIFVEQVFAHQPARADDRCDNDVNVSHRMFVSLVRPYADVAERSFTDWPKLELRAVNKAPAKRFQP